MDEAILHCTRGLGIWDWASNDDGDPDVVMACVRRHPDAGGPRRGRPPSASICRTCAIRFVNVVDLMRLQRRETSTRTACATGEFDALFTTDRPIVFAYHGYPWLIHRLTYRRTNHANLHVRGYKEEGTVTTPFDMVMRNDLDRFHLAIDVIDRVPGLGSHARPLRQRPGRRAAPGARLRPRARRGSAGDPRLDLAALT